MTEFERAKSYVGIFLGAGEKWRDCVPVDGRVDGDTVHIGGVTLTNEGGGIWAVAEPGKETIRLKRAGGNL